MIREQRLRTLSLGPTQRGPQRMDDDMGQIYGALWGSSSGDRGGGTGQQSDKQTKCPKRVERG